MIYEFICVFVESETICTGISEIHITLELDFFLPDMVKPNCIGIILAVYVCMFRTVAPKLHNAQLTYAILIL